MARRPATGQRRDSPLEQFVGAFGQLTLECADKAIVTLRLGGQVDDAEIAGILRAGLAAQTASLSQAVTDLIGGISGAQQSLLAAQTLASGGPELVQAARTTQAASDGWKIGIIDALEPIKKIIRQLLDILGIELPKWIIKLLDLIDNLLKVLWSLFGREAGQRAQQTQVGMYRHLREIYKTEAASLMRQGRGRASEEEAD